MTPAQAAQQHNRDAGGRYQAKTHAEANVSLGFGPSVTRAMMQDRMGMRPQDFISQDDFDALVPPVHEHMEDGGGYGVDDLDEAISQVSRRTLGRDVIVDRDLAFAAEGAELEPTQVARIQDELRRLRKDSVALTRIQVAGLGRQDEDRDTLSRIGDGSPDNPVGFDDPRLQGGEVFDTVVSESGTVYHRRREGVYPSTPYSLRIQTKKPMTDEQMQQIAGLTGYALRVAGGGEGAGDPERESAYAFTISADTTKGRQYRHLVDRFEPSLQQYMSQGGSPVRVGRGRHDPTAGTRLVSLDGGPMPEFEVFYDHVISDDR